MGIFSKFFGTKTKPQNTNQPFDKPRLHHYTFAHKALPDLLNSNPQEVLDLMGEHGLGKLKANWGILGMGIQAQGHEFVPDGEVHKMGDVVKGKDPFNTENCLNRFVEGLTAECFAIIIQLPKPQRRAEAYFVAVVVWLDNTGNYRDHRYFTLELTDIKDGNSPETVFCEWSAKSGHLNYGEGSSPNKDAFLELVRKHLVTSKIQNTLESDLKILETQGRDALRQRVLERLNKKE